MRQAMERLASFVRAALLAADGDPLALPGIAARAMRTIAPAEQFSLADAARAFAAPGRFVEQLTFAEFGNPPITYFRDDALGFVIDAYFWYGAETAIHDHGFSGAFGLLHGRTLHTTYVYAETWRDAGASVTLGDLACRAVERLQPGDVVEISPGAGFIHQTYHLEDPTVTLCIRSIGGLSEQRTYYAGGLAVPYSVSESGRLNKTRRLWAFLSKCDADAADVFLDEVIAASNLDFVAAFVLQILRTAPQSTAAQRAIDRAAARFPALGPPLAAELARAVGVDRFERHAIRQRLRSTEQRAFIAGVQAQGLGVCRSGGDFARQCLQDMVLASNDPWPLGLSVIDLLDDGGAGSVDAPERLDALARRHHLTPLERRALDALAADPRSGDGP